ncbi:hypothetical protein AcW1_007627 [Taiwanofungus camphoratus]|nr:hypothetical protein AcW2_007310 [Antrodia cinnamomea]KAI0927010.1 hypothetical protein AcV5_007655 [Antrodia cinnamomea]KAI0947388.1 hypothetical protein AcV7_009829 [Antrodia cinnamomea]KAI0953396.1 hypothetical protein AcW1_007627 [Antrodia cinnamomea]
MDDTLEKPTAVPKVANPEEREDDEQLSGDEDQGPDWTKLPGSGTVARPVIPKRGEKDFEPNAAGGSGLQRHVLDRARSAMVDALSVSPSISSKSISHAVWHPGIARAHVTMARGIHFTTMGHSVARASSVSDEAQKIQKRLELLPEEALYLVERGAMLCWKASDLPLSSTQGLEDVDGVPMSVQQSFAEMIGIEDLTLEKYQVFAYLKRLGYVVTRAKPPTSDYPVPPVTLKTQTSMSLITRLYSGVWSAISRIYSVFSKKFDWWRPLRFSRWLHHNMDSRSVFKSLRFLPAGYNVPLHVQKSPNSPPSPYTIFFHLYKPATPFKKTAPPPPDFSIVVVNARTTPMPTLMELTALFDVLPELPPPAPRRRLAFAQQKLMAAAASPHASSPSTSSPTPESSLLRRLFSWAFPPPPTQAPRHPKPFLSLKTGKKMIVVAAVDAGTISFFRFGQGVFTEWPVL